MRRSLTLCVLCGVVACSGSTSDVGHVSVGEGGASAGASGNVGITGGGGASSAGHAGAAGSAIAEGGAANAGSAGSNLAGSAGNAAGAGGASGATGVAGSGSLAGASGSSGASGSAGASGSSGASGGPNFAQVQAIFDNHCVLCHDKSKLGLPSYPALSLVQGDARAALVNRSALETCGGTYVVPGNPAQSYLIHKLSDNPPCEGARMPAGFEILKPPPLSAAELAAIAAWISAGAH